MVAGEESAEETNRDLEILDVDVVVERELAFYQGTSAIRFGIEMHENQRIERVDRSHEKGLAIPIVRCATERLERVVSPGVMLVIVPRVKALALYTCGELGGVHVIAGMTAAEGKKKEEDRRKNAKRA